MESNRQLRMLYTESPTGRTTVHHPQKWVFQSQDTTGEGTLTAGPVSMGWGAENADVRRTGWQNEGERGREGQKEVAAGSRDHNLLFFSLSHALQTSSCLTVQLPLSCTDPRCSIFQNFLFTQLFIQVIDHRFVMSSMPGTKIPRAKMAFPRGWQRSANRCSSRL